MNGIMNVYEALVAVAGIYVLLIAVVNVISFLRIRREPATHAGKMVSVLIPARNEAATIETCLEGLLDQSYQNYEIVVLDDDSTDETPTILGRLEQTHERLRVIRAPEKPEGWKGKTFAVQRLAEEARGTYLYIVDADTGHDHDAVGWAVTQLERCDLDAFSAMPRQITRTFAEKLLVPMVYLPIVFVPLPLFNARHLRRSAFGVGQFFVFRKTAFDEVGGMEAVREEITEDLAMSRLLKRRGCRYRFLDSRGHVRCRMYGGFRETVEGFTKNIYDIAGSATVLAAVVAPLIPLLFTLPVFVLLGTTIAWLTLGTGTISVHLLVGVLAFFAGWGAHLVFQRQSPWSIALAPVFFGALAVLMYYGLGRYLTGRKPVWKSRAVDESGG